MMSFRRLFRKFRQPASERPGRAVREVSPQLRGLSGGLSDEEYEHFFRQLLDGVSGGWGRVQVERFFDAFRDRASQESWAAWLQRYGDRLLASPLPDRDVGRKLAQFGGIAAGDMAATARTIGEALLVQEVPSEEVETLFQQGVDRLDAGQNEQALAILDRVLEFDPNHHKAWINRGNALANLKQPEAAIASYDRAIALQPEEAAVWSNKGDVLSDLERWEEAAAAWERALALRPDDMETWYNRGQVLGYRLKRWEEAIACWDRAAALAPNDIQVWFQRGAGLAALERWEEAIASWDRVLQIDPTLREVWINQGMAWQKLGQYDKAIAANERAIALAEAPQPSPAKEMESLIQEGLDLARAGKTEEALHCFDRAIAKAEAMESPDAWRDVLKSAWNGKGIVLSDEGDYDGAIAAYDRALALDPNFAKAWNNRGNTLSDLRRYQDALESYERAIAIQSDFYLAWNGKGLALEELGHHQEAIASYDRAIALQPEDHLPWYNRGNALSAARRWEEAVQSYDRALELRPNYYVAWDSKGATLRQLGRYEEALGSYDRVVQLQPSYYIAWHGRGNVLNDLGNYEEALNSWDRAIALKPDYREAWTNKATVLTRLGRTDEARQARDMVQRLGGRIGSRERTSQSSSTGRSSSDDDESSDHAASAETWCDRGFRQYEAGKLEDALASFERAIALDSSAIAPWQGKSLVLARQENYEATVAACDRLLQLTGNADWQVWVRRGWAMKEIAGWEAAAQNWERGLQTLDPNHPGVRDASSQDIREGCGTLHWQRGKALFLQGAASDDPHPYWEQAKQTLQQALEHLATPDLPQRYLEVLQDLILVRLELGEEDAAKLLAAQGAVKLEQLLATAPLEEKHHLAGKFAGLYQLQVDALAHTSIPEALALAERHRRLTLPQAIPFSLQTAQQQLNASDALVYWHLSPFAITTFLLFRDYPPSALADDKRAALQQRQAFQQWWQAWQDARQQPAWHQQMGDRLYQLTRILDFDRLQQAIATQIGEVNRLLLVPHGGLHWLPLDTLLAEGLGDRQASILYLPHVPNSDAIAKPGSFADASLTIAGADPEPLHTQIETTAIAALFQPNIRLLGADTTKTKLKTAIAQGTDILQFTGRARYLPDHPYRSAIALPAGQSLTLGELATWNLSRVRLICLPTCELASVPPAEATASGLVTTDPTLGNWATALLAAGATCVLHSLWYVDDLSTSLLLVRFYELLKAGHAPHPALSQARHWLRHLTYAQLAIWQGDRAKQLAAIDPECSEALMDAAMVAENRADKLGATSCPYAHPYYWAGFVLTCSALL